MQLHSKLRRARNGLIACCVLTPSLLPQDSLNEWKGKLKDVQDKAAANLEGKTENVGAESAATGIDVADMEVCQNLLNWCTKAGPDHTCVSFFVFCAGG